jgi:undecaprenyl-diphosphatase
MPPLWQILILALIQGLTEFLPVSSSGHLVIAQHLMRFGASSLLFDIILHAGTLLAVLTYFRRDLIRLVLRFYEREQRRLILLLALATFPTALIALPFRGFFESLFSSPRAAGIGFLATALLLFLSHRVWFPKTDPRLAAIVIGIFQGLAIMPGLSRSGTTIAVALMLGLGAEFSFRFSFLLSIPAILGALLLKVRDLPASPNQLAPLGFALVLAALFGLLALGILKRVLGSGKFHRFAYYCLAAGILVLFVFGYPS